MGLVHCSLFIKKMKTEYQNYMFPSALMKPYMEERIKYPWNTYCIISWQTEGNIAGLAHGMLSSKSVDFMDRHCKKLNLYGDVVKGQLNMKENEQ